MPSRSAIPVTVATSVVREMAGRARLPTITGCTNSTATCCASVLAVPVPNTTSLPPWWNCTAIAWHAAATASACSARALVGSLRRANARRASSPAAASRAAVCWSLALVMARPGACGRIRQVDLDRDVDGVADAQRTEERSVRLDAVVRLDDLGLRVVAIGPGLLDLQPQRPRLAAQRESAADLAGAAGRGPEAVRGEHRLRVLVGAQHLARGDGDLPAVPVGQRLDPARPVPHDQGSQVDVHLQAGRAEVLVHPQVTGPPGGLHGEVMTCLRGQTITESAQQNAATAGTELVPSCDYHHG